MTFTSLEQRMAWSYLDTLPPFVPASLGPAEAQQRAFYDLVRGLYQLAFEEPQLFVAQLHEDDAYPNRFNKSAYGKPELLTNMKKFRKEMDALLQGMFQMGIDREAVKLSKRQKAILLRLGIGEAGALPPAWLWMATRPGADPVAFAHCLFDEAYPYVSDLYARLLGDEAAFRKLETWMLDHGYRSFLISNVTASDDTLSLTYANPLWSPKPPKGGFEYGIRHTGISVRYDAYVQTPPVLGLCIPNGLRDFLTAFDQMDPQVQAFTARRTKRCDGCGYCVQTDKTGQRPKAFVPVQFNGNTLSLCTYFPGYAYCWSSLTQALADDLIALLAFMDSRRPSQRQ